MTSEEKKPVAPEDAQPELEDDTVLDDEELEELVEEAIEALSDPVADPPASSTETTAAASKLQHEIEVLRQQLREKEENYVRLYADFDNFRKRTQREKEELGFKERQKLILEVLPTVDNFERAQQQIKLETEREQQLHNSYQSVYRLLVENLKRMGVSRMKVIGQTFDPNLHEAVAQQPSSEFEEGIVSQEFQPGYKLGEVVLRHALVVVSAGAPEGSPAAAVSPVMESTGSESSEDPQSSPESPAPETEQ